MTPRKRSELPHLYYPEMNQTRILNPHGFAAGGGGGITDPLDIAGCVLWLDGSDASTMYDATTDGSLVADDADIYRWEDKSTSANHATQGTAADCPHRRAASVNSLDSADFDGAADMDLAFTLTATDCTIIFATERNTSSARAVALTFGELIGDIGPMYWASTLAYNGFNAGYITDSSAPSGVGPHVLTGRKSGTSTEMWINGPSSGSLTVSAGDVDFNAVGRRRSSERSNSKILEIIVYESALSTSDRESVEDYLGTKWGTTITH